MQISVYRDQQTCCLDLSGAANQTVHSDQHAGEEVLAQIATGCTGSPKILAVIPKGYIVIRR